MSHPKKYVRIPLEVAVFSGESILKAQSQGASRVELNAPNSYVLGGTTPPVAELLRVAQSVDIPVRIMIRPRGPPSDGGQDFIYTASEVEAMKSSIKAFKESGVMKPIRGNDEHDENGGDGFVFGLLKHSTLIDPATGLPQGLVIDETNCQALIQLAKPFPCVFHRAFDSIAATDRASDGIESLTSLGFDAVLTAGGNGKCIDNLERIENICHKYAGDMQIAVGGGLRQHNIPPVAKQLASYERCSVWMHSAALTRRPDHPDEEIDSDELISIVANLACVESA